MKGKCYLILLAVTGERHVKKVMSALRFERSKIMVGLPEKWRKPMLWSLPTKTLLRIESAMRSAQCFSKLMGRTQYAGSTAVKLSMEMEGEEDREITRRNK